MFFDLPRRFSYAVAYALLTARVERLSSRYAVLANQIKRIEMKKLLILFIPVIIILTGCKKEKSIPSDVSQLKDDYNQLSQKEKEKNAELFFEAVEILPKRRISITDGKYAKVFSLRIHDPKYIPLISYALNGEEFTDDGKWNDLVAKDGVYTSISVENSDINPVDYNPNSSFKSEKFKYSDQNSNLKSMMGGEFGCKIRRSFTGKTILGFSCENSLGCIELYDCSFKFTW